MANSSRGYVKKYDGPKKRLLVLLSLCAIRQATPPAFLSYDYDACILFFNVGFPVEEEHQLYDSRVHVHRLIYDITQVLIMNMEQDVPYDMRHCSIPST